MDWCYVLQVNEYFVVEKIVAVEYLGQVNRVEDGLVKEWVVERQRLVKTDDEHMRRLEKLNICVERCVNYYENLDHAKGRLDYNEYLYLLKEK